MTVTDQNLPNEADAYGQGGAPTPPPAPGTPPPNEPWPAAPAPEAPPAKPASRARTFLILGGIVVFIGVVLFLVRNNVSADDLKVGDCFVIPNGTTVQTVEKHPCNESHNAEVVHVGDYTGDTYPISLSLDSYIEGTCIPAFEAYVGEAYAESVLEIGYFYPTQDGWNDGDRSITCYVTQPDDSMMTESLKAS